MDHFTICGTPGVGTDCGIPGGACGGGGIVGRPGTL